MTTPTQPLDLHAGARKIADGYTASAHSSGSSTVSLADRIVALAEAHATATAGMLREALVNLLEARELRCSCAAKDDPGCSVCFARAALDAQEGR